MQNTMHIITKISVSLQKEMKPRKQLFIELHIEGFCIKVTAHFMANTYAVFDSKHTLLNSCSHLRTEQPICSLIGQLSGGNHGCGLTS